MSNVKNFKKQYFKLSDDNVIYPASILSRIGARLLDFFFIWIIPFIITVIYIPLSTSSINEALDASNGNGDFSQAVNQSYDAVLMFVWILTIVIAFLFLIVLPYFNKKNYGQTFGKKILHITPLYVGDKNERNAFVLRELPIFTLFILPALFEIMMGYDASSFYFQFLSYVDEGDFLADGEVFPGSFEFFSDYWANGDPYGILVDAGLLISTFQVSMAYLQIISSMLFLIVLFILWISMLFENQKRGLHDQLSKTAVVNLRTMTTLESAEQRYNELVGNFTSVAQENIEEPITLDVDQEDKKEEESKEQKNISEQKNKEITSNIKDNKKEENKETQKETNKEKDGDK